MTLHASSGLATSLWLIVVVLVVVATGASYVLSRARHGSQSSPRVIIVAGVTAIVLLTAAVLVVVTSSRFSAFLAGGDGTDMSIGTSASSAQAVSSARPGSAIAATPAPAGAAGATTLATDVDSKSPILEARRSSPGAAGSAVPVATHAQQMSTYTLAAAQADPWAATSCIRSYRRDPQNATRQVIENECPWPVAIVVARCATELSECNARAQWSYEPGVFTLPTKLQRPVFAADETREGQEIRVRACFVLTPQAIDLIGADLESRSTALWQEQWHAVRPQDECLTRVEGLSDWGRRTGRLVEGVAD